jgi:hypothetical protein
VRRRVALHVALAGAYLVVATALTYPVVLHPRSTIPIAHQIPDWRPGDGDPWQALWAIWMMTDALLRTGRVPMSTNLIFHPLGVDMWYAPATLPVVLPALPLVRMAGIVFAYNAMMIGSLALAGYAAFLLVRRLTGDPVGAFVGGLVFAFCPYQMAHALEHVFLLVTTPLLPLYVLCLLRALDEGRRTSLVGAAVALTIATIANIYYLVFLALFTALLVGDWWRTASGRVSRRALVRRLGVLIAAAGVLTAPFILLVVPRIARDTQPKPAFSDVNLWNADVLAFVTPSPAHPWWGAPFAPLYARFTGNYFEQTVYLGYVALALAIAAVAWRRQARFWAVVAVVFAVMALGPLLHVAGAWRFDVDGVPITVPLPAIVFHFLPGVSAVRVFSRFTVIVMLALAVLAGYAMATLRERLEAVRPRPLLVRAIGVVVGLAVLLDYLAVPLPVLSTRIPRPLEALGLESGSSRRGSVLDVPLDWRVGKYEYYQTAHGRPLLVGLVPRPAAAVLRQLDGVPFVSFFENPARPERRPAEIWDRRAALRVVDLFDLEAIVIHRSYLDAAAVASAKATVAEHFPVAQVLEDESVTVMRLRRDHDPAAVWTADAYDFEFGADKPRFFIGKGWWPPEGTGGSGMAWSMGRESTLGFYLPRSSVLTMTLEVTAVPVAALPAQRVAVMLNDHPVGEVELDRQPGWRSYAIRIPVEATRTGINLARFAYAHSAIPRDTIPGSSDPRELAVAFRRVLLRPQ